MEYANRLQNLNEQQILAVTAPLQNTLVLAGAGSGKTTVLVNRIAWLVQTANIPLSSILAVTFTNKAANEMRNRLTKLLHNSIEGLWIGTFHSLCHRILKIHHLEAKLPAQFQILDQDDQARIIKNIIQELGLDLERWPVKQAQNFINSKKDEGLRAQHIHINNFGPEKTLLNIYQHYESLCFNSGLVDFAELLFRAHELLRDTPNLLAYYHKKFQAILVDEFQDTNTLQYAWVRLLASGGAFVMAVGDDDQSIYGWRGAKVENLQQFPNDFSSTNIIRLEQNYRSSANILNAANALIENNQQRMGKNLWTEDHAGEKIYIFNALNEVEEAQFVCHTIQEKMLQNTSPDELAILYRSNAQSRVLEEVLLRNGIAYHIHGGLRFFERMEIKDLLGYLRIMLNIHDDIALERIINTPTRGISDTTVGKIRECAKTLQKSMWDATQHLIETQQLPARALNALSRFTQWVLQTQQSIEYCDLDEKVSLILEQSGLYNYFANLKGINNKSKLENLRELVNAAKQFQDEYNDETPILSAFLAHTSLDAGELMHDDSIPSVSLMTLHASKGLEFPVVFMVGMEEGVFPSKMALIDPIRIEEERRLCYVGMTRAQKYLIMSYANIRRQYGKEEYHRPSRFLREVPHNFLNQVSAGHKNTINTNPQTKKTHYGFSIGQNVTHSVFGEGVVLALEGSESQARAQVRFDNNIVKWLALAYANLN